MEEVVISSIQLSTLAVQLVLGISAMLIVLHLIRVQLCFVSIMRVRIVGCGLNMEDRMVGLDILTCHHMEEGKVPSSMAGSQDALLPTLIGRLMNPTIPVIMKIMRICGIVLLVIGMIFPPNQLLDVAVSTSHPQLLQVHDLLLHHPDHVLPQFLIWVLVLSHLPYAAMPALCSTLIIV